MIRMKIPLLIRKYSEGLKPFCELHIRYTPSTGRPVRGVCHAFVDTGSPITFISQTDANRLNIQPSKVSSRTMRIGGSPVLMYSVKNMKIKVMCEDNKTICDLSLPTIGLALPIPNNTQSIKNAKTLPSIIGVDMLKYHKLALYFDVANDISYLEKH